MSQPLNLDALERDAMTHGKLGWKDAHALVSHARALAYQVARLQDALAVPDGYALAPVKPSIAACIHGAAAADNTINGHAAGQVYAAMLHTMKHASPASTAHADAARSYPSEITPALREVLSLMVWRSGQIAHVLRAGGADIPKKAEAEQAHVLHWLIQLALEHGSDWWSRAYASLQEIQNALGNSEEASNG
ncbi:hypothetical protein [Cupriavidus oxalaticus]|uniref:Uncharacterized protein n=1 Tax=Cupriavidus oxalaticus TaxID=96344 RepID=A0A4P7LIZ5_9BURK|nr:hypothetical protein [Cupriavidus oxalaticus]QBY56126.1 hypothetical protein E0W60_34270 [Cupriavidus oxalaticus]